MGIWSGILSIFESSSVEGYSLQLKTSMILIAILCLVCNLFTLFIGIIKLVAQSEAWYARAACCTAREHALTLRTVTCALFRVANLLLIYASVVENGSLMQIYVWYTLAYIVVGFAAAIFEMLLAVKHEERCVPEFVSEVVFLFVLSRCLPLVDTYRRQLIEA